MRRPRLALATCHHVEYPRLMSALRRSIFLLIAAAALMFGVGSFTAAMACPSTLPRPAAGIEQTNDSCCEQAPADDCVLRTCSLICHALPPGSSAPIHVTHVEAPYWVGETVLMMSPAGPEPPPPRFV